LASQAEALGEARHVAAEAVGYFLKRRGGQAVDNLLAAARRGLGAGHSSESVDQIDDGRELLRLLERQLRAAGRA
jgi:hypothetical protein